MLSEERRQAYLKAMGIEILYPRRSLPGAAASPRYVFAAPEPAPASAAAARASLAQSAPAAARQPASQASKSAAKESASKPAESTPAELARSSSARLESDSPGLTRANAQEKPAPPPDTDAPRPDSDASPSFLLRYYSLSPRLAVLCELPRHASARQTRQALELLQAILRALDVEPALEADAGAQLQWPLHEDMTEEQASARHAAQVLDGFIRKQLQQTPAANLLVLGERIAELLPGASVAGEASDYPLRALSLQLTRVSSLGAMLSMPDLKPDCWRDLQPLRDRLRAASP